MSLIFNFFSKNAGLSNEILEYMTVQDIALLHATYRDGKKIYDGNHAGEHGTKLRQITQAYLKAEKEHETWKQKELSSLWKNIQRLQKNFNEETQSTWLGRLVHRITFYNDFLASIGKIFFIFCCVRQKSRQQIQMRNQINAENRNFSRILGSHTPEKRNYDAIILKTKIWAPVVTLFNKTWKKLEEQTTDVGQRKLAAYTVLDFDRACIALRNKPGKCFMRGSFGPCDFLAFRAQSKKRDTPFVVEAIVNFPQYPLEWRLCGDGISYNYDHPAIDKNGKAVTNKTGINCKILLLSERVRNYIHRQSQMQILKKEGAFELNAVPLFLLEDSNIIVHNLFGGAASYHSIPQHGHWGTASSQMMTKQSILSSGPNTQYYINRTKFEDYIYIVQKSVKEKQCTIIYFCKAWPKDKKYLPTTDSRIDGLPPILEQELLEKCTYAFSEECLERLETFAKRLMKHLEKSDKTFEDPIPKELVQLLFKD